MSTELQLKIIKATNIHAADRSGTSDPYLTCYLKSEKENDAIKTSVIKETLNPEWNLNVKFTSLQNDEQIMFRLYDWNRFQSNVSQLV
ncbi:predicted protein [Naegleria gruberi]|uniref:Predicted protein n=1 Tax=Naegleria gruberi TaxID=5762 RepID=D2V8Y0_NAEGR|nr:uncharacterized protein NAEGRDRAFT_31978 [Naegleria gruberi]EFC46881.1 predicted protein [Naegleria gruberi]|eukprot:XP_002679625.1 predicted protein [Naegleria gruberi strain NEG-M]